MKKLFLLSFAVSLFIGSLPLQAGNGVVINGITWATCNVDAPGVFTTNPEDYGMFYQWSSKVGWPSTGAIGSISATNGATTWDSSWLGGFSTTHNSNTWPKDRDPSPTGYHVPTIGQIENLLDTTYVSREWTTQNGISGTKFTDKTSGNSIFLPASGSRDKDDGSLNIYAGWYGYYWGSTTNDVYGAHALFVDWLGDHSGISHRAGGFAIRPVADNGTLIYNAKASNLKINTTNGKAEISGLPQGASVTVYNLQGVAIYSQKATEETISVNLPARGVYVVKVGTQSLKVIN